MKSPWANWVLQLTLNCTLVDFPLMEWIVYWGPMASQSLSGCCNCLTTGNWVEEEEVGKEVADVVVVEESDADEDRLGLSLTIHH